MALVSCHQSKRYTWRQLRDAAHAFGARPWCLWLGMGPGDRVGLWSTNCVEWVLVHLACARAGAVLVNVGSGISHPRIGIHSVQVEDEGLVPLGEGWQSGVCTDSATRRGRASRLNLEHAIFFDTDCWNELLTMPGEISAAAQRTNVVANIQYTFDPTGQPKGVNDASGRGE